MLRDASEHSWPNFVGIVKGKRHVRPARSAEYAVRAGLTLDGPAKTFES
jgi:hypothetical protein